MNLYKFHHIVLPYEIYLVKTEEKIKNCFVYYE